MEQTFVTLDYWFLVATLVTGLLIRPSVNVLELRYVFVAAMTLGFCGHGLLELTGAEPIENHLMVIGRAPELYRYVAVCVLGFWAGYHVIRWRYVAGRVKPGESRSVFFTAPSLKVLLVLAVIPILIEAVVYGWDIFLGTDNQQRGELAQTGQRGAAAYLRVISRVLDIPLGVVAGLAWQERKRAAYWVVPALLSLPLMAQFSRGMFLPFVAFLFGAVLMTRGRGRIKYIALAGALVFASFTLGIKMREYARTTGLGHYADILVTETEEAIEPTVKADGIGTPLRSLVHGTTALPRATLAFEIGPRAEGHKKLGYLLLQLPIPSFLLPPGTVPATSLTDDLGLFRDGRRGTGFPYPLIAEMKVFLGWLGPLVFLLLGLGAAMVDNLINDPVRLRLNRYLAAIFYGLMLNFIVHSFHSGLRASARPIMYVAGLWFLMWLVKKPERVVPATAPPAQPPIVRST